MSSSDRRDYDSIPDAAAGSSSSSSSSNYNSSSMYRQQQQQQQQQHHCRRRRPRPIAAVRLRRIVGLLGSMGLLVSVAIVVNTVMNHKIKNYLLLNSNEAALASREYAIDGVSPNMMKKSSLLAARDHQEGGGTGQYTRKQYPNPHNLLMPAGVNLGSWLSLEDYFFAGQGSVEVATPFGSSSGVCLPPLHTGPATGPRWYTETDLLENLTAAGTAAAAAEAAASDSHKKTKNATSPEASALADAVRVIHAHRVSFLDWHDDLPALAALGITRLRVPVSWCFTDSAVEDMDEAVQTADELYSLYTCQDPYLTSVKWPAVPKLFLERFLQSCSRYGVKAVIDIHTYPGGTSIGTFSGVWPRWPAFWNHDDPAHPTADLGRNTFRSIVHWFESLAATNPAAFAGLGAISVMNEPAHLTGLFDGPRPVNTKKPPFVPKLPPAVETSYLSEINDQRVRRRRRRRTQRQLGTNNSATDNDHDITMPAGAHLRVLLWLRDAVSIFRGTSLPTLGVECHVNVIESIFAPAVLKKFGTSQDLQERTQLIAVWWNSVTSAQERATWAVLDYHRYHAWDSHCQGTVDGGVGKTGNWTCGMEPQRTEALTRCTKWAAMFRDIVNTECGTASSSSAAAAAAGPAKLASAEFSASTHHAVRHACNDLSTLLATYRHQTETAAAANIDLYFWSWHMPYGGTFRNAWSLKHLLYRAGVLSHPDERVFDCGEHVPVAEEPADLSF